MSPLSTLLLLLFFSLNLSPTHSHNTLLSDLTAGLTYRSCATNADCRGDRSCISSNGRTSCEETSATCFCIPSDFIECSLDAICPRAEVCARLADSPFICLAPTTGHEFERVDVPQEDSRFFRRCPLPERSEEPSATPSVTPSTSVASSPEPFTPTPSSSPFPRGSGLSYDTCATSADCAVGRECLSVRGDQSGFDCCRPVRNATCACIPDKFAFCARDSDCGDGEDCVSTRVDVPRCVSKKARDGLDGGGVLRGGICVDVDLLGHLDRKELVFEKHARARVLCDEAGSCATPGHVVRWGGRVGMMRSYCEEVGCVEKVIWVNSPRYRVGLLVPTRTKGLAFTAFAARFETRAEEGVLAAAVRLGL